MEENSCSGLGRQLRWEVGAGTPRHRLRALAEAHGAFGKGECRG